MTTAGELAVLVGGSVLGDPKTPVAGFSAVESASAGTITFAVGDKYRDLATRSAAAVVVVDAALEGVHRTQIVVKDPNLAFAIIVDRLARAQARSAPGIDPRAVVEAGALVAASATVKAQAYVARGAQIGEGVVLHPGVYVGEGAIIGDECILYPNAVVMERVRLGRRVILQPGAVVGSDGFGYATSPDGVHVKIPQTGTVVVEDDVEIGSCSCVDRARFAETRIGQGTKIDNLVQIAHNVVIGPHSIIVSQVGIAGSTRLGHHVVLAGHVGVAGHLTIGDGAQVTAFSGVGKNLPGGQAYTGIPARPMREGLKVRALEGKLPELFERLKAVEKALADHGLVEGAAGPGASGND